MLLDMLLLLPRHAAFAADYAMLLMLMMLIYDAYTDMLLLLRAALQSARC